MGAARPTEGAVSVLPPLGVAINGRMFHWLVHLHEAFIVLDSERYPPIKEADQRRPHSAYSKKRLLCCLSPPRIPQPSSLNPARYQRWWRRERKDTAIGTSCYENVLGRTPFSSRPSRLAAAESRVRLFPTAIKYFSRPCPSSRPHLLRYGVRTERAPKPVGIT